MTDQPLPPAVTSVELRLDALIQTLRRMEAVLDRAFPAVAVEPQDGEPIDLKEPAPVKPRKR